MERRWHGRLEVDDLRREEIDDFLRARERRREQAELVFLTRILKTSVVSRREDAVDVQRERRDGRVEPVAKE